MALMIHELEVRAQQRTATTEDAATKPRPAPIPVEERWALAQQLADENQVGLQLLAEWDRNPERSQR